jgi:polyferredoxin
MFNANNKSSPVKKYFEESKRSNRPAERKRTVVAPAMSFMQRFGRKPHLLRRMVQMIFLTTCLWIGWRFLQFYDSALAGGQAVVSRPPGVEAFLPISALLSARLWLQTGVIHPVHPAGFLIFAAILTVSFLFKRSFCSWICPFGLLSEKLGAMGRKITKRNLILPKWADRPLRTIKYLLLAFFIYVIFCRMDLASLQRFLESPFNQMADVRLLQFFLHPSVTTLVVLAILAGLSVFIRHFWCRYLCPYGALTALAGLVSPTRIKRDIPSCIECGKCARGCPASLPVNRLLVVHSDECTLCLECVESCPVPDTLGIHTVFPRRRVHPLFVAAGIVGIFLLIFVFGKLSGQWRSSVPVEQISQQIQYLQLTAPRHP